MSNSITYVTSFLTYSASILQTKELLLKLEIAETAIQEIRLRILAMDKDLKHKTELQDLMHKLQKNLPSNFENSP